MTEYFGRRDDLTHCCRALVSLLRKEFLDSGELCE